VGVGVGGRGKVGVGGGVGVRKIITIFNFLKMYFKNLKTTAIKSWNIILISILCVMCLYLLFAPLLHGAEKEPTIPELQAEYKNIESRTQGLYRSIELTQAEIKSNEAELTALSIKADELRLKSGEKEEKKN